jgi:hypothetical protein
MATFEVGLSRPVENRVFSNTVVQGCDTAKFCIIRGIRRSDALVPARTVAKLPLTYCTTQTQFEKVSNSSGAPQQRPWGPIGSLRHLC